MITKREKLYFLAIVCILTISSIVAGFFDDLMGGFTMFILAEVYRIMRESPPTEKDKEYYEREEES